MTLNLDTNRCDPTGKVQYVTARAAKRVAEAAAERLPFRVYRCEFCRYWHLTTQKKKRTRAAA